MQVLTSVLVLIWMVMVVISVIGLIRGRVRWARIGSRRTAGWVLVASVAVFIAIGLVAPKQDSAQKPLSSAMSASPAPTTSTQPMPVTPTTTTSTPATTTPTTMSDALEPPSIDVPAPPTQAPETPIVEPVVPAVTTPPAPAAPVAPTVAAPPKPVTAGAFCSSAGATGTSKTGKPMVCETASDGRLRWRQQ